MMSVTPSSSKPPDPRWDYDVYLSFIGDETSYDFMYYLFGGLERNGVVTFRERPPGGENIPTLMLKAIQRSRIFIVVLSQGYVCSEYCLNELVEIVHRRNIIDHIFFPILYQLGPSDVQKRIETLEEVFPRSEEQFGTGVDQYDQRMQGWRAALTEVMNSSDQILHDDANGSMGILKSVEEVLDAVCTRLNIPRNTLRMDSCVEMMTDFLHLETSEIYIVGMSCMDEILKETLIGVVYSQIYHGFERTSLILDITEISKEPNGLVHLQEQLLGDIVGMNQVNINNADEGIRLIKEAIQGKRVLIVLDNVDELKQLHTLIGNSKCFGPGSKVIAVSRENQLRAELEAHGIYDVEDLPEWKSPQLFIWRASMMAHRAVQLARVVCYDAYGLHYVQQSIFDPPIKLLSAGLEVEPWKSDLISILSKLIKV
ncbi:disease resistance protein RPV1-like [Corylus avellana]|uniref:disease resistance protein RPV1-like n=1 Tax=Corylus avellana TaxID=13451 RepID=UPI00286B1528|nr:disease resistance protein RPV1-like [Corylus avellana]